MLKYIFFILIFFSIVLFNSCKSNPASPSDTTFVDETAYHQINITQTDYLSFEIASNENFVLNSNNISAIILQDKNSDNFYDKDTILPVYEKLNNNFQLKFKFILNTGDSTLLYKFALKYVFTDNTIYDVDTSLITYRFTYPSTEILYKWADIMMHPEYGLQDFEMTDLKIYCHPFGPGELDNYDITNYQTSTMFRYPGGDYLAISNNFVFCDINHTSIGRYNLAEDIIDTTVSINDIGIQIKGMDVYGNKLYVSTNNKKINLYNLDLKYEGTIPFDYSGYYLAIKDSIIYCNNYSEILRFNLKTNTSMDPIPLPTLHCEAIAISGDKMLFSDYGAEIIGCFNLSEH